MIYFMQSDDTARLLIDHQSGLFQAVKDIDVRHEPRRFDDDGQPLSLPVITTASVPEGPNGPLMGKSRTLYPMRNSWRAREPYE